MRLSTAMLLGSATCKMVPGDWDSCALGAAANAVGLDGVLNGKTIGRIRAILNTWPWLSVPSKRAVTFLVEIFTTFDLEVCKGLMTYEQLVDYVHSVEPECGECNQFECTCPKVEQQNQTKDAEATALLNG